MYDSRNERSDTRISTFDFLGPIKDSCDSNVAMDPCGNGSQKHNKSSKLSDHDGIQFRTSKLKSGDEPGVCSPPSWSKSPPRGPPVHPKPSFHKTRNSPPSLRVQAIARGQKELMEMVKAMPESSYELSLKDLVDHQNNRSEKQEEDEIEVDHQRNGKEKQEDEIELDQEKSNFTTSKKATVKKQGSVRRQGSIRRQGSVRKQPSLKKIEKKMLRNESNISENGNKGLFLKLVFPMPFGGGNKNKVAKPKTKAKPKENPYAEASTKLGSNTNDKSSKSTKRKEWWKRRYPVASDGSESSGLSSNGSSGSSGSSASNDSSGSSISNQSSRKKGGLLNGCSPFYYNKNKTIVE